MAQPSWLESVPQLTVQNEFQDLVLKLHSFSAEQRHVKYAEVFLVMADPLDSFLSVLHSSQPPQDVMVATLSGCLRTLLQQLMSKKTGLRGNAKFTLYCQQVSMSLTKFVGLLQEALRAYQIRSDTRSGEVRLGLTTLLSHDELHLKINDLRKIPAHPQISQLFWMSLSEYPIFTQAGLLLIFVAIGSIICSSWYSSEIDYKRLMYIIPATEAGIGLVLMVIGYCRAYSMYEKMVCEAYALTNKKNRLPPPPTASNGYIAL